MKIEKRFFSSPFSLCFCFFSSLLASEVWLITGWLDRPVSIIPYWRDFYKWDWLLILDNFRKIPSISHKCVIFVFFFSNLKFFNIAHFDNEILYIIHRLILHFFSLYCYVKINYYHFISIIITRFIMD